MGVARSLIELASWYSRVYNGLTHGFSDSWNLLVNIVIKNSSGGTILLNPEAYTMPLPSSLDEFSVPEPFTFYADSSRPSSMTKMDQGQIEGLLNSLTTILHRDYNISVGAGAASASATANTGSDVQERIKKLVLIGASNLRRTATHLASLGYEIIDL